MKQVTVLICTHNRVDLLTKAIRSIIDAHRPANWQVEILVVANACSDQTHDYLARLTTSGERLCDMTVRWLAEPTPGKSNALNTAFNFIKSELLILVDDDHRVEESFLTSVCGAAESHETADIICGRILPDWTGNEPPWVHDTGPYRIYPLPVPRFDQGNQERVLTADGPLPGGGNLCIRTHWLSKIGPFRSDMGPTGHDLGGAEDLDWVLRAMRMGAHLRYIPSMIQYHYVDTERLKLSYLMRKAYKRTASTIGLSDCDPKNHVPKYVYRKIAEYAAKAVLSVNSARRRFYLVRTAAALGELVGYRTEVKRARP